MRVALAAVLTCLTTALIASGCAGVSNARKIDYRNAPTRPNLEVPPDLTATLDKNGAATPQGAATYSGYAGGRQSGASSSNEVLPQYPNVRLMRDGRVHYVLVHAEPGIVWGQVRDFLTTNGLSIAKEDAKAGLMETDWAENHALVGASESNGLSKWLKSFYSTGTRDKYRVRLERGTVPGTTEIFLTHEGMREVAPDTSLSGDARPGWTPRPRDPELEVEMLHRLVVYLGGPAATGTTMAKSSAAPSTPESEAPEAPPPSARLTRNTNGAALLTLQDSLERAWRRVGLSLDRIGFTVEDRDRSKGIYYVRYIDPDRQAKGKGFFSRLFGGSEHAPTNQYQVHVKPADDGTDVEVLDKEGDPEASKTGERILSLLYEQLK
jgi:outer membrane protein assembly factor BamC